MKKGSDKDKNSMGSREVAVLVEDLRSKFRAFGEGLSSLQEKVDAVSEALAAVMERITAVELRLAHLETKK